MPGLGDESEAIFRWLADEVSPDTFVNIMGQYRPAFQVGQANRRGRTRYDDINRRPRVAELDDARQAAARAGLWRFDERH